MVLGIVAGSAGIPAAFLVATIVAGLGALGSAFLSTGPRQRVALERVEVTLN